MRIAIVTQYYAPEVIRIPDTLARSLVERGHSVRVLTGFPNYPDGTIFPGYRQRLRDTSTQKGVRVRRVPLYISHSYNPVARLANYLSFAASAALNYNWIRHADVVYVYATQMTPAIGPSIWWKLFKVPFVMHVQDLWPESITGSSMVKARLGKRLVGGVLRPWLRHLYRNATATIAIAPTMAVMLEERGVPAERLHTVLNWSADEGQSPDPRVPSAPRAGTTIVYAGNLGDHQALDSVVEAANRVKHIDGLRILIVGSGVAETRLRELARRIDAHNVEFLGRVIPEEMGAIHSRSDFQIISLRDADIFHGTIPSKLQASLSHGIPVITAVAGDVKRIVEENTVGFACDPDAVDQLASAFQQAAGLDDAVRIRMGNRAREYYEQTMSIKHGVDRIEEILAASHHAISSKAKWSSSDV